MSTVSNFSNCILKCLWSRTPRPDKIKGILNVMNWLILTAGYYTPLFTYSLYIFISRFLAFLQSFLGDKKVIKLGSKAVIFLLLFHELQHNMPIYTLVLLKFLYVPWEVKEFSEVYFRQSISIWNNLSCFLFQTPSSQSPPESLGASAKKVSKALELGGSAKRGKEGDSTASSARGETKGTKC